MLGGNLRDTSEESFINANEIFPGLIAAQCPMTSYPHEFANTVEDMKRMLVEQDVRLWVQLSPASQEGELMSRSDDGSTKSFCEVFPLKYLAPSLSGETNVHQKGVSEFSYVHNRENGFFNMTYKLTAFVRREGLNRSSATITDSVFDPMTVVQRLQSHSQVQTIGYLVIERRETKHKQTNKTDLFSFDVSNYLFTIHLDSRIMRI